MNAGVLRELGFKVYSEYALRNFDSLDAYYTHVLTDEDITTFRDKLRRYSATSTFYAVFKRLKNQYDIFLTDPDHILTFRRLERFGVTKEEICSFADSVAEMVGDGEYFTVYNLREKGLSVSLDRLGFDDFFLTEILIEDSRFASQRVFGTTVLCKTEAANTFMMKEFLFALLSECESIDIDDFANMLKTDYGIPEAKISKIIELIRENPESYYYDEIMRTIYRDKGTFLSEFDD